MNREIVRERNLFYRGGRDYISPTRGPIRLGPDRDDLVTVGQTTLQRWYCSRGRSHEDNSHKLLSLSSSGGTQTPVPASAPLLVVAPIFVDDTSSCMKSKR